MERHTEIKYPNVLPFNDPKIVTPRSNQVSVAINGPNVGEKTKAQASR